MQIRVNSFGLQEDGHPRTCWTISWKVRDILLIYLLIYIARIPKEILECDAVAREINFSSREQIQNFR